MDAATPPKPLETAAVEPMGVIAAPRIGVPVLSREHEQRTLLLAWSQDVSPVRWLWTKLALLGGFVAALTAVVVPQLVTGLIAARPSYLEDAIGRPAPRVTRR